MARFRLIQRIMTIIVRKTDSGMAGISVFDQKVTKLKTSQIIKTAIAHAKIKFVNDPWCILIWH